MSAATPSPLLSEEVQRAIEDCRQHLRGSAAASRFWRRCLTPSDRQQLGGNLEAAYAAHGIVGMWRYLQGVSEQRAVIDVGQRLGFLNAATAKWLLEETEGDSDNPDVTLERALQRFPLVIVEHPRQAFWRGEKIEIDWDRFWARWDYLLKLCEKTQRGSPLEAEDFGKEKKRDHHIKLKSKLTCMEEFPLELANLIIASRGGGQRLQLEPEQIRILCLE